MCTHHNKYSVVLLSFLSVLLITGCQSKNNIPKQARAASNLTKTLTPRAQCVNNFELLKGLNEKKYEEFKKQFDKLNASYMYYAANNNILDQDPKEIIPLELDGKLNTVCTRVKNEVYLEVQKRMNKINDI
ncbi:hypothetical protein NA256_22745 [Salmonella sp. NW805]|uniref:hypothetical protein n=1 Tax=unclassified Salmonella TaxID=2614656 RepID=UPI003F42B232|nr:hypothetical protein [Salmonella enterica]HBM0507522.1 hypothetical protein [Salmonella enterica]